jgi:uncharacterized protein YebE (UPF0316 family)
VVFAAAFSSLMANLDAVERVAGYALGVAAGTFAGMALDDRLSLGQSVVRVVAGGADLALVDALRRRGWPATAMSGDGLRGEVTILFVTVEDSRLRRLLSDLEDLAPDAFWTVERLRSAHHMALPEGCVQVRGGAAVRTASRA